MEDNLFQNFLHTLISVSKLNIDCTTLMGYVELIESILKYNVICHKVLI